MVSDISHPNNPCKIVGIENLKCKNVHDIYCTLLDGGGGHEKVYCFTLIMSRFLVSHIGGKRNQILDLSAQRLAL